MANVHFSNIWLIFQERVTYTIQLLHQTSVVADSHYMHRVMIVYDNLWETMKKKNITQYKLIHEYGISAGQLSRLRKNSYINTHTLDILCEILQCDVSDVMTFKSNNASR